MEKGDYINIERIKDKKLYDPDKKEEFEFDTLYKNLESNQLLYVVFFRRWGCVISKASALELNYTFNKVNKEYPGRLKFVGVGLEELGYDDFKKKGYFKNELYVNRGKTIYKAMNFQSPGFLEDIENKFAEKKLKTDNAIKSDEFQLGGSIMITPTGNVIFQHQDSYLGDHAKEVAIIEMINNYFGNDNIGER